MAVASEKVLWRVPPTILYIGLPHGCCFINVLWRVPPTVLYLQLPPSLNHTDPVRRKRPIMSLLLGYSLGLFFFGGIILGMLVIAFRGISLGLTATMTLKLEKDETGEKKRHLHFRIMEAFETNSLLLLYFGEKPILFQPAGETQAWCGWKSKKNRQGDQSDNHRRDRCERRVRWMIAGIFTLLIIAGMILWYVYLNKKPDWIPLVSVRLLNANSRCPVGL